MNELTKEELEELEEQENKLREKRETQDCINCIILLILFIIQGIVLPIIYTNHQSIWGITHIKMVCIVSVCYYTLKQIFFSETDGFEYMRLFVLISVLWFLGLLFVGICVAGFTNLIDIDQIFNGLSLVLFSLFTTIITMFVMGFIDYIQECIRDECNKLELNGYKQKAYQITENTKYFIILILVLAIIFIVITLLSNLNWTTINWEKPIIYLGTPYCLVILGILLRLD